MSNQMMKPDKAYNKQEITDQVKAEINRIRNYTPKVAVFGDTGVGKSSLCNALFGKEIAKISNVEACTRKPQEILLSSEGSGIILIDVPGVGEDASHHAEYTALYKSLLPELDLVMWAIKADDRKYFTALNVYEEILKPKLESCPVIFVITQADKIDPHRKWNEAEKKPGDEQMANLDAKIKDVSSRFCVSENTIVAVSASDSWNLVELVNKVVEVLPNEKKYGFAREAKEENVSEDAAKAAEKGLWDWIKGWAKEKFVGVVDYFKDIVDIVDEILGDSAKEKITSFARRISRIFWGF